MMMVTPDNETGVAPLSVPSSVSIPLVVVGAVEDVRGPGSVVDNAEVFVDNVEALLAV